MILKCCLLVKEDQPLLISANSEILSFVRLLASEAYKLGVKDVYFDITDPYLKHDLVKKLELKDLKKHQYFNKMYGTIMQKKEQHI